MTYNFNMTNDDIVWVKVIENTDKDGTIFSIYKNVITNELEIALCTEEGECIRTSLNKNTLVESFQRC